MLTNQTGHYYFNLLSEEEQQQFKENYTNDDTNCTEIFDSYLEGKYLNFLQFISVAFSWSETPQKHEYWFSISLRNLDEQPTPEPKEPTNSELQAQIVELKKEMNMLKSHLNIQE